MDIIQIDTTHKRDVRRFLDFPFQLYRQVSQWVPPFASDARRMLDRKKHPFYQHSAAEFFIAQEADRVVGRIAVLDHRPYNEWNHSSTAFFYLFEAENNRAAAQGLFDATTILSILDRVYDLLLYKAYDLHLKSRGRSE